MDHISDVNFVRNNLAVTSEFKPEISYIQKFYIQEGVRVQVGTVGPPSFNGVTYTSDENQVQIVDYNDRSKLIPIGEPRKISKCK